MLPSSFNPYLQSFLRGHEREAVENEHHSDPPSTAGARPVRGQAGAGPPLLGPGSPGRGTQTPLCSRHRTLSAAIAHFPLKIG
jgi:hypothetical protein